jgi:hypothetical protein
MPKSKARKKRAQGRNGREYGQGYRFTTRSQHRAVSGPVQLDDWLTDRVTLPFAVIATAVALCVTVVLAFATVALDRDTRAFEDAPVCTAGKSVGCLTAIPATIQARSQYGGGKAPTTYYVDLSGAAPANGEIDMAGQNALWNVAAAGDEVTAFVWNGAVVRVDDAGVSGDTSMAPGARSMLAQGFLISGVVWILVGVYTLLRLCDVAWTRRLVPAGPSLLVALVSFPLGALIGDQSESLTAAMAFGIGFSAFAALFETYRWLRYR